MISISIRTGIIYVNGTFALLYYERKKTVCAVITCNLYVNTMNSNTLLLNSIPHMQYFTSLIFKLLHTGNFNELLYVLRYYRKMLEKSCMFLHRVHAYHASSLCQKNIE